jgi:hypothetical protein
MCVILINVHYAFTTWATAAHDVRILVTAAFQLQEAGARDARKQAARG